MTELKKTMQALMNDTSNVPTTANNKLMSVKSMVNDMVKSLELIESEREHLKEVAAELKAQHGWKPKVSNKVAKIIHKGSKAEDEETASMIDELHSLVTG